jgi:hypothetical protein
MSTLDPALADALVAAVQKDEPTHLIVEISGRRAIVSIIPDPIIPTPLTPRMAKPVLRRIVPHDVYEVRLDGKLVGEVERMGTERRGSTTVIHWVARMLDSKIVGVKKTRGAAVEALVDADKVS